jgi:DNA-binding transcriptional LysR family regulator
MNVRLAILFAAVAEERSFTRAAARLNIAQPWLSAQVRKFEEQLGFQLFDRGKGAIQLTPEGEKMFPAALELAATAQRLRDLSRTISLDVSLFVKVGAHASSGAVPAFARLNDEFAMSYRDTSLIVEAGSTMQLLADVASGRLDAALVMAPFDATGLKTIVLSEIEPYLLVAAESPLAGAGAIAPAALSGHRLGVTRRADHPVFYDALHGPLEAAGAELKPVPETGRAAMEHFARTRRASVVMVEGDPGDYAGDDDLRARPLLVDVKVRHVLVKRADLQRRAVDRYWRAAEAAGLSGASAP